jgi:hypothetical protein
VSRQGARVVLGPPDSAAALVPVAAGELTEWAHQLGWLTAALDAAAETTRFDLDQRLPDGVTLQTLAGVLDDVSERIGALLDGDGWWQQ